MAAQPRTLFHFVDPRIDEASGMAVSRTSPGVVYVQNDSGDRNRFFAVDERTGVTTATITVPGATNVDWEDLAVGPGAGGRSSVWLADIGDNGGDRSQIAVYRVDEPVLHHQQTAATGLRMWRLRYPSGPTDAESFAVAADGRGYIVTKSITGSSVVYRLPARPDPDRVQTLRRVASINFLPTGTTDPFGLVGQLTATGAAFSRDGSLFAVRTYADAYLWHVTDGDLAAALRHPPTRIALPTQPQGEGIAIDGSRMLIDSEGERTAVLAVPLPARAATRSAAESTPRPTPRSTSVVRPTAASPAAGRTANRSRGPDSSEIVAIVAVALVLLLGALARVATKRRAG